MPRTRNSNGQGTIIKRGERHYEWRVNIDGKRHSVSATSRKELQEKIDKKTSRPFRTSKDTVDALFKRWLENCIKGVHSDATYEQYDYMYKGHISPVIGKRKLSAIEQPDIQEVIATANKKGLSTWTMKHIRKVMRLGFEYANTIKARADNPVFKIIIPEKQAKEKKVLSADEVIAVLDALKTSRWIHSFRFLLATGLRKGELLALKHSDIDMKRNRIRVDESVNKDGDIGDTKGRKVHYVPLTRAALSALEEQEKMLKKENNKVIFKSKLSNERYVFPNENGTAMRPDSYYNVFYRLFDKEPKDERIHVYPHALRHTFVYLTRGDLTLKELQDILGHSSSTVTTDIYGDIINDTTSRVSGQVNSAMDRLNKEMLEIEEKKKEAAVVQMPRKKKA